MRRARISSRALLATLAVILLAVAAIGARTWGAEVRTGGLSSGIGHDHVLPADGAALLAEATVAPGVDRIGGPRSVTPWFLAVGLALVAAAAWGGLERARGLRPLLVRRHGGVGRRAPPRSV
jgi:hypothetical protein